MPSSATLARNLEDAGFARPEGSAAHHIVAGSSKRAAEARAVLQKFGIDINSAENGVFLPRDTSVKAMGATHSTIHTTAYYDLVNMLLRNTTTREGAIEALSYVRKLLLAGQIE